MAFHLLILELLLNLLVISHRDQSKFLALKRFLFAVILFVPLIAGAQLNNIYLDRYNQDHHEFGITVGIANYYGDLQPKLFPNYGYMPMFGIVYKYFMNPHIGLRFGASYTKLTAADSLSNIPADRARNLSFATNLFEVHGGLEFNFWPVDILKGKVTPYVFGGISAFYFNPYADDTNGARVYLRPLSTEGQGLPMYPDRKPYSLVNVAFPFGGGMKFFIGKAFFLTAEMGFRYTNTDYLDDVSKTYVNLDTLQKYKGVLARRMSYRGNQVAGVTEPNNPDYGFQRGDTKSNDWYWFGNVTVTVYLKALGGTREYLKTRCPAFFGRWW